MSLYKGLHTCLGALIRGIFRVKVVGSENLPKEGSYIVACNHLCDTDPVVLAAAIKSGRQIRFMAKKEVFKVPIVSSFVKAMGAFPVDRKNGDVGAVKKTIELLKSGECVGIFPQGTRQGGIHPKDATIKNGIGMFAEKSGVGILPVCIRTKKNKLKLFRKTEFIIGNYISPEELKFEECTGRERYSKISEFAFSKIAMLYDGASEEK